MEGEQYVKMGEHVSSTEDIECGVPQGSVLGLLLYSLYVLSLQCSGIQARYITFADDTVLLYSFENEDNLELTVNTDLQKYMNWLMCNRLKINTEKTQYMIFKQKNRTLTTPSIKINNINIAKVEKVKYLGLIIDEKLNWNAHVNYISDKIVPMVGALYKNRDYLTFKTEINVYNSYFLSHFRYLLPIWGNCGIVNLKTAQTLQNKVLKVLFNYNTLTHTEDLYAELGVCQISKLLKFEQCKLMHKIINKKQKTNTHINFAFNIHSHHTRSQRDIYLNHVRTNKGIFNPLYQASILCTIVFL